MSSKATWKRRLKKACLDLGTYKPSYDLIIDKAAKTLELMDSAMEEYEKNGGDPVVTFANGNTGTNSYLKVWHDLNNQNLKYMDQLGLSPSSNKKVTGEGKAKEKPVSGLASVLASLG